MNSMNNDGTNFSIADPSLKPAPLARPQSQMGRLGISPFDVADGTKMVGNGNNGDFRALPNINPMGHEFPNKGFVGTIPLRQERAVSFGNPMNN